jgi:hypothetical protein
VVVKHLRAPSIRWFFGRRPVAHGLEFADEPILKEEALIGSTEFEKEACWNSSVQPLLRQVLEQSSFDVICRSDVNPLSRVREAINA